MISILEILGCFTQLVLLVVFKASTLPTLINGIFLWSIVLPYAFLMNTSDNKQRIIQTGWVNIFKNVFKLSANPNRIDIFNKSMIQQPPKPQTSNASDQPQKVVNKQRSLGVVSVSSTVPTTESKPIKTNSRSACTLDKNNLCDPIFNSKSLKQLNVKNVILETPKSGYVATNHLDVLSLACIKNNSLACKSKEQDLVLMDLELQSDKLFNFNDK